MSWLMAALLHANNELNEAYAKTFSHGQKITLFTLLQRLFPVLSAIVRLLQETMLTLAD